MLEALGVVEIRRGLCTVISKNPEQGYMNVMLSHFYLNSGNEEDLQNFRYIIESAYTTYAIHQATDNDLAAIREKLELFREKLRNGTLEAEDDILFHGQILQATHNSFMISLGNALNELFRRSIAIAIRDNPEVALHDHESIYQAIVNRDPVAAEGDRCKRQTVGCIVSDPGRRGGAPPYNIIKSDGTTRHITGPFLFTKFYKKLRNHP